MNVSLPEMDHPVRMRFEQPVSDEELLQFCERNHLIRVERDANGQLILMSPTGTDGGNVELDIATELNIWARQDGRGRALGPNSGMRLPDTAVLAADAGWVSWERYNGAAGQSGFREFVPEFVVELRSEGDRMADVGAKMERWMAYGVELGWLIDLVGKVVEIYRPGRAVEEQVGASAVYGEGRWRGLCWSWGGCGGSWLRCGSPSFPTFTAIEQHSMLSFGTLGRLRLI